MVESGYRPGIAVEPGTIAINKNFPGTQAPVVGLGVERLQGLENPAIVAFIKGRYPHLGMVQRGFIGDVTVVPLRSNYPKKPPADVKSSFSSITRPPAGPDCF